MATVHTNADITKYLVQEVMVGVPVLVVEMSQNALVVTRFTEADRCERLQRRLPLLRRVRRAVCGSLMDRVRDINT